MCVVSMVSDWGIQKVLPNIAEPVHPIWWPPLTIPNSLPPQDTGFKVIKLEEYVELVRKAKEYDERTNQPECPDPEKMAKMEEYCKKFESMGTEMFRLANELRNLLK